MQQLLKDEKFRSKEEIIKNRLTELKEEMDVVSAKRGRLYADFAEGVLTEEDYIEHFFPFMGVRFLAVADGYDSDFHAVGDNKDIEIIMKILSIHITVCRQSRELHRITRINEHK